MISMRLAISLILSLFLVGSGYLVYTLISGAGEPVEVTVRPVPVAPRPMPPAPAPAEPPRPVPVEPVPPREPESARIPPGKLPRVEWSAVEQRIFDLTNEARKEAHLSPLKVEDGLRDCALVQSADMIERKFFDHVNPSGENPSVRVARIHRRLVGLAGENIWKADGETYIHHPDLAKLIFDAWMHSPGHRANILWAKFTHLGVGVSMRGNEVRATQNFARVRGYLKTPLPETVVAGTPVDLSTYGDELPAAEMYSLDPMPEQPIPIAGAKLNVPPGRYGARLYFRDNPNSFMIFSGPSILVTKQLW